jgi:hypothetical protein
MWTPGYWAFDPANGYYWVPGTWVEVPAPGMYWTPGYWGWGGAVFVWHAGYWGPHVGFYGGINYGFGYTGVGFVGGEWRGRDFYYNRSVANVAGAHITNVYYHNVTNNFAVNRVSYNGGEGGLNVRPGSGELAAEHDRHIEATSMQQQHETAAHNDRSQFASTNHGLPAVAATGRPGEFKGPRAVAPVRAGGAATPGGYHATNSDHTTGYSGFRNPNSTGPGVHQPAGESASSVGPHATTSDRTTGYSGFHNPNSTTADVHQPTGESASSVGSHATTSDRTTGYSGFHNPNPSGGGTRPPTTSNTYSPGQPASGGLQHGTTSSQYHPSAPPAHNGPSGGPPARTGSSHPPSSPPKGSQPSGGGHSEKEPEKHR